MTLLTRIAEPGCGCGATDHPYGLVTIDEAVARVMQSASAVAETEEMPLAATSGRILAEPVRAQAAVPPFDNSAMDGYAINTGSLTGAGPWRLDVIARIAAGRVDHTRIGAGEAAQIFTGAPIPQGADAVVMQEDVDVLDGSIFISKKITPYTHIRTAGEDMLAGATIVPSGRNITAREIAACAAAGAARLRVHRRLRVALVVTGHEVNSADRPRNSAGIWDVNTPMLSALIATAGIDLVDVETGKDNRDALRQQLADLATRVDLIVTTGGISVGEEDHVKPALKDLGATMVFSGVAMKPGKPVSYGRLGQAHWLGLPGNPLSAFVTWQLFGTVLCRALTGDTASPARRRHVVLSKPLSHRYGRCELRLAEISGFDGLGREIVHVAQATHSGRVAQLPFADGLILIPADTEGLPQGALVEFQPF